MYAGGEESGAPADYSAMPVESIDQRDAETRRLAAESEDLLEQSFVLANPQSDAFRDYLDRLYQHTRKLTALIAELPRSDSAPVAGATTAPGPTTSH
jgi:hypothetical protein